MQPRPQKRRSTAVFAAVAALALAGAGIVFASVTVYSNGFPNKHRASEMDHAEGDHCEKAWKQNTQLIKVDVKRGQESCGYRPPVEGDGNQPDQIFEAKLKILKDTSKHLRKHAFVGVDVRSGGGDGYELRIFPKGGRFELLRRPGGGSAFPVNGTAGAIKGIGDSNVLRLSAKGGDVKAYVNDKKVAAVTDNNPAEVGGRKLEVVVGNNKDTKKDVFGTFDDLKAAVPNP